jgi:hypothetical protein
VAVFAFLLSCYSLYLHRRDVQFDLRLRIKEEGDVVTVTVANAGHRPVQVTAIHTGFRKCPTLAVLHPMDGPDLPRMVGVGRSVRWSVSREDLDHVVNPANPGFRDPETKPSSGELVLPDTPEQITSPPQKRHSRFTILKTRVLLSLAGTVTKPFSHERISRTGWLSRIYLHGSDQDFEVITVEDALGNLYNEPTGWVK